MSKVFAKARAGIALAWAKVKGVWPWVRWVFVAAAAVLLWRLLRARAGALVDFISKPAKWSTIPGVDTHVVALNPDSGEPEVIELPAGVYASQVVSVGISEVSGGYHVEANFKPTDRSGPADHDGDLAI